MKTSRLVMAAVLVTLITIFFVFDFHHVLNLSYLKAQQANLQLACETNPWRCGIGFIAVYIIVTGASLPGALILSLAAGAIFGFWWGLLIVSFSSVAGATVAFLIARYLFHDFVQTRFAKQLKPINAGIQKDGAFYLFTIRMVAVFPFFIVNMLMALTPIKTWTFAWVSQLGMLPVTAIIVNAGTQLAKIESLKDILSPGLLFSFMLIGVFPLIAKKLVSLASERRIYQGFAKPKNFDANLIVIGAGSAGLVCAYIASQIKAKVILIEQDEMGGDCLNRGCVPSKALIAAAKIANAQRQAVNFGITLPPPKIDFTAVMAHVHKAIDIIAPNDSVERYTKLGVEVIKGRAKLISPYTVTVNERTISARNIIVATGAGPFVPPIPGVEDSGYLTSDTLWQLQELPNHLLVLGGGPIGCELAQSFARLGSRVTIVEMLPRILIQEDEDLIRQFVEPALTQDGVVLKTATKAIRFEQQENRKLLVCESEGEEIQLPYDEIIIAVGRKPNATNYGLEELGIELNKKGGIAVNENLQTTFPNIYACGDIAGPYQFTHVASHQAWFATINALFGQFKKTRVDYSIIPWATFLDPEIARVGLNESQAIEQGLDYEITKYDLSHLDRAIADGDNIGCVKVLTVPGKDKILGVTIVAGNAGELIAEFVLAMRNGLGLNKILRTIHVYPTMMEANKFVAGQWRREHAPKTVLSWLQRFHAWRLGK